MPQLTVTGSYVSVEALRRTTSPVITDTSRDQVLLDHLDAASRDLERATFRRFFPVIATNLYRWPPFHVAPSWAIWTEDDLLSVSSLQVAATGQNAVPVTLTHFYLEPQTYGPPYNRVEVDLSSSDVFQSGPTPQRSLSITGQWGYCNTTTTAGTLGAAITDTTGTSITLATGTAEQGDVLLIDAEALYVPYQLGATGSKTVTVQRGTNGTTPATHLNGATVSKYVAPANVRRVVEAAALQMAQRDLASWGQTEGEAMTASVAGTQHATYRDGVIAAYARRRTAAV